GTFGSTSLTSKGDGDIFVTRLDPSGNFQWAQRAGGENWDLGYALAIDSRATDPTKWAVYITGVATGSNIDFGPTITFTAPNTAGYVAKMDATTGSFTWAVHFGGSGSGGVG